MATAFIDKSRTKAILSSHPVHQKIISSKTIRWLYSRLNYLLQKYSLIVWSQIPLLAKNAIEVLFSVQKLILALLKSHFLFFIDFIMLFREFLWMCACVFIYFYACVVWLRLWDWSLISGGGGTPLFVAWHRGAKIEKLGFVT